MERCLRYSFSSLVWSSWHVLAPGKGEIGAVVEGAELRAGGWIGGKGRDATNRMQYKQLKKTKCDCTKRGKERIINKIKEC